ncbi:trimethyllysine dioxygenase, mitochondrial [Adelges cooleyi]|uniref:trimethyllysine dioxygenase, mitochondrial n=1 Tax=Adelges cooleyi TaxID=133065 RepID=UPI0021806D8E|nr:trimethyllysine dioxygenase, mitochondrial [Adelges cooleyi]
MAISLEFEGKSISINTTWLYESCRCEQCYDATSKSRITSIQQFLEAVNIKVNKYEQENDSLHVEWSNGHASTYDVKWVFDTWTSNGVKLEPYTCVGKELESLPARVDANSLITTEGQRELVRSILKYGIGVITNVEPTLEATEKVIRHIAKPYDLMFGPMWIVGPNEKYHKDPAYSNGSLVAHNDNTYLNDGAGLQVFHMLERDNNGTGGLSTAVDGFKVAEILKQENHLHFKCLTEIDVETEYVNLDSHYKWSEPVIKINSTTNDINQIRFNIYDRTCQPQSRITEFYASYAHFVEILKREELYWEYALQPGTVVIYNNWRILHGRTAFTGKRVFVGCYVSTAEFLSKARTLGLIS